MKRNLPFFVLLLVTSFTTGQARSQSDRFAYAITDVNQGGANWSYLRKLNLQNGEFSNVLLNGTDAKQIAFDAITKKSFVSPATEVNRGFLLQPAFSSGVAAMAYDKKNNRLWYTPMFIDQLRYIDLKSMKVYYVSNNDFTGMAKKSPDQGNIITRMAMGDDGYGYALTNDGANLVRFSTGKNISVTNMGTIVDDPASKGVSIHSSCTSFGGDMIADNQGNLYVFSARNHVFKVNVETKVSTHLGTISGLPANFTSNGAVVTTDNKILVSSALDSKNFYTVDPGSWTATPFVLNSGWGSSDLANGNILDTRPKLTMESAKGILGTTTETGNDLVQIYPNPVTNNKFAVQFSQLEPGEYSLQVTDVMGKQVLRRIVNVSGKDQTESVGLNPGFAKGFYLVNILDKNSKTVFSKKLIVE
jgi:hypothetical protein